jgi:N-methylhydantoinase A
MLWVGVDVGGTFTDLVVYDDATRRLEVLKTPSTPHDQSEGIFNGLGQAKLDARDIARFVHGTTVATNTALERNGARMAVLVTAGHRDVLIVGRGNRTVMYDIKARGPEPIVRRDHCIAVDERMGPDGRAIRRTSSARRSWCGRRCPMPRSPCRARYCPSIASTSGSSPRRSTPTWLRACADTSPRCVVVSVRPAARRRFP